MEVSKKMQSKIFRYRFGFIGTCALALSLGAICFIKINERNSFIQRGAAETYTFILNKNNAPTLTGADKEQKEVIATGLSNILYMTYSKASNASYAHAVLANGGYISNNRVINDIESLVVAGSGSFRLGYGIETITNYINISLDDSSYTLENVDMNYFKLVATSDNAVVSSISGVDACTAKSEYGVREYSTQSARNTDKMTRLVHDVPATQAFTYNISWTQTETDSSNNNFNPKIMLLDADALYKADDSFATVSDSNIGFGCRGVQFGEERTVMNYKNAATAGNNVTSDTVAGTSKAGVANAFVDASGTIFTTGLIDDESGKPVGANTVGWSKLRMGATVDVSITYTPEKDGLHEFEVVWNIMNTIDDVYWSFTMTQRARFSNISNIAVAAGAAKCNWTVISTSCTGLN